MTHVLEIDLSLEVDESGFHQVGGTGDERVVLGHKGLHGDTAGLSSRLRCSRQSLLFGQEFSPVVLGELASQSHLQLLVLFRVLLRILLHRLVPLGFSGSSLGLAFLEVVVHLGWDNKLVLRVESESFLDVFHVLITQSGTVDSSSVLLFRRMADDGLDVDQDGLALQCLGLVEAFENCSEL